MVVKEVRPAQCQWKFLVSGTSANASDKMALMAAAILCTPEPPVSESP